MQMFRDVDSTSNMSHFSSSSQSPSSKKAKLVANIMISVNRIGPQCLLSSSRGVVRCATIREVGLYGCHRADCANILLPAVAKMLTLTMGRLEAVRLQGCTFPSPSNKASQKDRKGSRISAQSTSPGLKNTSDHRPGYWKPKRNMRSSVTVALSNAIAACATSVDPPSSLCTLDLSGSTMGSHAAMVRQSMPNLEVHQS